MATYETWFVADDEKLEELFPGWVAGEAEPRLGGRLPVWAAAAATVAPIRQPPSDYMASLEASAPAGLHGLPHFCWKGAPYDLLGQLSAHFGWSGEVPLLRKGPPEAAEEIAVVQGLPDGVLAAIAAMSDDEVLDIGIEIEGAFDVDDLEHGVLLLAIRDLAKEALRLGSHVCLFMTM